MLNQDKRWELRVDIRTVIFKIIEIYKIKGPLFFLENPVHSKSFVNIINSIERLMIIEGFSIRDFNVDYEDFVTVKMFAEMIERNINKVGGGNE